MFFSIALSALAINAFLFMGSTMKHMPDIQLFVTYSYGIATCVLLLLTGLTLFRRISARRALRHFEHSDEV